MRPARRTCAMLGVKELTGKLRLPSPALACRRLAAVAVLTAVVAGPGITAFRQAVPAGQQSIAPAVLKRRLQASFDALREAGRFPGGTAGFALADGTSFGIATGYSDPTPRVPMSPTDRMLMGGTGKTYVSAVALQLVQEKRLALSDSIEKWLGSTDWFARLPNGRDITVRMLMNHTSGLGRYDLDGRFASELAKRPDKTWRAEELIAYVLDSPPPFAAGTGWQYSDTNYILLGLIIERVTGSTYYQELERRVLVPFKLKDTVPSDSRTIPGLVQGFAGSDNPYGAVDAMIQRGTLAFNPQFEWTGGGLAATSLDLARWARVLYEGRAFNKTILAEMLRGVPTKLGPDTTYGLGVMIRQTALGSSYGHSGFFPGYLTDVAYFPSLRTAIAVQVNSSAAGSTSKPLARFLTDFAHTIAGKS